MKGRGVGNKRGGGGGVGSILGSWMVYLDVRFVLKKKRFRSSK